MQYVTSHNPHKGTAWRLCTDVQQTHDFWQTWEQKKHNYRDCSHGTLILPLHNCCKVAARCPCSILKSQILSSQPSATSQWSRSCSHLEMGQIFFRWVYILAVLGSTSSLVYVIIESETLKNLMMAVITTPQAQSSVPPYESWNSFCNQQKWAEAVVVQRVLPYILGTQCSKVALW